MTDNQHLNFSEKEQTELMDLAQNLYDYKQMPSSGFQKRLKKHLLNEHRIIQKQATSSQSKDNLFFEKIFSIFKQLTTAAAMIAFLGVISVAANEDLRNNIVDTFQPKGSLLVISDPADEIVKVYIDTEYQGDTPLELKRISTGKHILKTIKEGYKEHFQEFNIETKKLTKITIKFGEEEMYSEISQNIQIVLEPIPTAKNTMTPTNTPETTPNSDTELISLFNLLKNSTKANYSDIKNSVLEWYAPAIEESQSLKTYYLDKAKFIETNNKQVDIEKFLIQKGFKGNSYNGGDATIQWGRGYEKDSVVCLYFENTRPIEKSLNCGILTPETPIQLSRVVLNENENSVTDILLLSTKYTFYQVDQDISCSSPQKGMIRTVGEFYLQFGDKKFPIGEKEFVEGTTHAGILTSLKLDPKSDRDFFMLTQYNNCSHETIELFGINNNSQEIMQFNFRDKMNNLWKEIAISPGTGLQNLQLEILPSKEFITKAYIRIEGGTMISQWKFNGADTFEEIKTWQE